MDEIEDKTFFGAKVMGGGSWLLKGFMEPAFAGLKSQVEGLWQMMVEDLGLYQMDKVLPLAAVSLRPCSVLCLHLSKHTHV